MQTRLSLQGVAVICLMAGMTVAPFMVSLETEATYTGELKAFSSRQELVNFIENRASKDGNSGYYWNDGAMRVQAESLSGSAPEYTDDFSSTNLQVVGVDEPDMVKTDGGFLYIIAQGTAWIVRAYPPYNASLAAQINFTEGKQPRDIFIQEDVLVVLATAYHTEPDYWATETTVIHLFNISDRYNPRIIREITVDGWYLNARMIGEYLYTFSTDYLGRILLSPEKNQSVRLPQISVNGTVEEIAPTSIYYPDDGAGYETMVHVTAVHIATSEHTDTKSYLMEYAQDMYVSRHHVFLTNVQYNWQDEQGETTIIHKIAISNGTIAYVAHGEVPGRVLNQFSMDDHQGFFRVATTSWNGWWQNSSNNLYILDNQLHPVSQIENIAPGESIYSARFMGDRAYLVTFKKVDPFFTIDLSNPEDPQILGELKITGYSDYLQPYDENHIIGIGKEAVEASPADRESWAQDFAWYQGLKIALFNVTDFENPQEVAKVVIGDRGTDSLALHDHHAVLFDQEKELLVLPVSVYEIDEKIKQQTNYTGSLYGSFVYQGAYVLHINTAELTIQGTITHQENATNTSTEPIWYRWQGTDHVLRSLYIDTTLFTISESMVKLHNLSDLAEMGTVPLLST